MNYKTGLEKYDMFRIEWQDADNLRRLFYSRKEAEQYIADVTEFYPEQQWVLRHHLSGFEVAKSS